MDGEPRNAASDMVRSSIPGLGREYSWEAFAASLADGFVRDDRRPLIGVPTTDAAGFVDGMRAYFDLSAGDPRFSVTRVVAVRGERLALVITRADYPHGGAIEILSIVQFDRALSRLEKVVEFDTSEVSTAIEEIDQMYIELTREATDTKHT